jgi:hypothetical protein
MSDQPENPSVPKQIAPENAAALSTSDSSSSGTAGTVVVSAVTKTRKTLRAAVGDTIKALMPEKVVKLADDYGPALLVGFCLGLVFGTVFAVGSLIGSESLRAVLLPPPSKDASSVNADPTIKREKPANIIFSETDTTSLFLQDYEKLLGNVSDSLKQPGSPLHAVVHDLSKPTQEFNFRMGPRQDGSLIFARLFRRTMVGEREIFEPLSPLSGSSQTAIRFKVPECDAGDKLFMVVLVIPSPEPNEVNYFTEYFYTELE